MTVGYWSPHHEPVPDGRDWRVVASLDGPPPDRLVVPGAEWDSYLAVLLSGAPAPPSVVLWLEDGADVPPDVDQDVDAMVRVSDRRALASALRITDTELADWVARLSEGDLAALLMAAPADAPLAVADATLEEADIERALESAHAEARHRYVYAPVARRALDVHASLPEALPEEAPLAAALVLIALLRGGMRAAPRLVFRSKTDPDAVPNAQEVGQVLDAGRILRGEVPGAALEFRLAGDALVIASAAPVTVRVSGVDREPWVRVGTEVELPLALLRGAAGAALAIAPAGPDAHA